MSAIAASLGVKESPTPLMHTYLPAWPGGMDGFQPRMMTHHTLPRCSVFPFVSTHTHTHARPGQATQHSSLPPFLGLPILMCSTRHRRAQHRRIRRSPKGNGTERRPCIFSSSLYTHNRHTVSRPAIRSLNHSRVTLTTLSDSLSSSVSHTASMTSTPTATAEVLWGSMPHDSLLNGHMSFKPYTFSLVSSSVSSSSASLVHVPTYIRSLSLMSAGATKTRLQWSSLVHQKLPFG
mmetsp:Transcript_17864/g.50801  ORF Transcript_17864/g.50801 Transcript_17864/m.50801 type:complete len:235 (+) Transcript_17864:312-1016(+)